MLLSPFSCSDAMALSEHGWLYPFNRNYLCTRCKR